MGVRGGTQATSWIRSITERKVRVYGALRGQEKEDDPPQVPALPRTRTLQECRIPSKASVQMEKRGRLHTRAASTNWSFRTMGYHSAVKEEEP